MVFSFSTDFVSVSVRLLALLLCDHRNVLTPLLAVYLAVYYQLFVEDEGCVESSVIMVAEYGNGFCFGIG